MENNFTISTSSQIHASQSTAGVMWFVTVCLLPSGIWSIYLFGTGALNVVLAAVGSAVFAELCVNFIAKKITVQDGSAFLTGLLIAYNMPPGIPLYIPMVASCFAILVVKWSFGGLGGNWMNPALAGRVFVFFSWTKEMTRWTAPRIVDAVAGATPLGFVKTAIVGGDAAGIGPLQILRDGGYGFTESAAKFSADLHNLIGLKIDPYYFDMFIGHTAGSIGEMSALLLLIGAVVLMIRKIVLWQVPFFYILSFGLLTWVFGGKTNGLGFFQGDVAFHLFSGGLILGAFYMATDMSTSPLYRSGTVVYGIGLGFLTFLIRFFGSFPEGVSLAIIFMNIFVPMIDRFTKKRRYGIQTKRKPV